METRSLTEADLPALLDLCRRTLPFDVFTPALLRRRVLEEPNYDPRYQLCLWDDTRLIGVVLGGTRVEENGPVGWVRLMTIDPPFRRRGLATGLLGELESRLRADGLTTLRVANSTPNYFWPGLDLRYTPALCLLLRQGFRRYGDAVNMQVDLDAHDWSTKYDEVRLVADGFVLRRLESDDREAFSAWLTQWWERVWHYEALSSYENDPISTFIATNNGRICAFASYDATTLHGGFGPMGTEPELRGRGLGRVLFYRCMQDLQARGDHTAEVCWVGPIPFYTRVADAWINRTFWFMEKSLVG